MVHTIEKDRKNMVNMIGNGILGIVAMLLKISTQNYNRISKYIANIFRCQGIKLVLNTLESY